MAMRPVFLVSERNPFYTRWNATFEYNSGFAPSQKRKNIQAIHDAFSFSFPGKKVLEISSKSMQEGGEALSAFFLKKFVPSLGESIPVENVYQAGKVFEGGGPFTDLLQATPRAAKKDERLRNSGRIVKFCFDGTDFPTDPTTIFYNFIYINALLENEELAKTALRYDAFTDIEFNPEKSLNCQAQAAAIFVSLSRQGLIEKVKDFEEFSKLFLKERTVKPCVLFGKKAQEEKKPAAAYEFAVGEEIEHKTWGKGMIIKVDDCSLKVKFKTVGEKNMGREWVANHCKKC